MKEGGMLNMDNKLEKRTLGRTGLELTKLGYGSAVGMGRSDGPSSKDAERLLNAVLDAGINFIDTAPDYGDAEKFIGNSISHRRNEYFLATKCGCNIDAKGQRMDPGHLWTADRIRINIEQSLERMKTDYVDLLQMHNPTVEDVEKGGLIDILQEIQQAGKTRFIGVSSTAPHLLTFARMGVFDSFQIPYSALERKHERMIEEAALLGAGIIIRGGIARGHNVGEERSSVWERAQLDELLGGMNRHEFVLRFTLTHPSCHTTIVGTGNANHLQANIATAKNGTLPSGIYEEAKRRLSQMGEGPEV